MGHTDICIVGAGVIGLSLALEMERRGAAVTVLERDAALSHASTAAAGMLAADDPENPPQLEALSALSIALYPEFLARLQALSGLAVPFQTRRTLQAHASYALPGFPKSSDSPELPGLVTHGLRFRVLDEHSIDPRQLAASLLAAVRRTSIRLVEHAPVHAVTETLHGVRLETAGGSFEAASLVSTTGAWGQLSGVPVVPRKGQMLTVALPPGLGLREVIRTPEIYIVPRTEGPRAGCALLGATVEDAGYDVSTEADSLDGLRATAAELLPVLADRALCPAVDQWAGLRSATADGLPILDRSGRSSRQFVATGHYRNGILLAPATAHVLAQLLTGETPSVDLSPFRAQRFPVMEKLAQERRYSPSRS